MAKVIVFGIQDFAQLAHYYLTIDSEHEVVAFSVNEEFLPEHREYCGLPIVPFEIVADSYDPDSYYFFAPLSPKKMNIVRKHVFISIKQKGFRMISYISSKATIFNNRIGVNCFILEDNTLQPFTNIGDNVVMWSGNHIGHHGIIKDHAMFTSHVVLSGHCVVEPHCFFGVNSTIRDGLTIAEGSLVAMGATVTRNTEEWGVYTGNPAKKSDTPSSEIDF